MPDADSTHASATDEHDNGHGHGHAPQGQPLGPVDLTAWAYALAGAALGALVALALFIAKGG